MPREVIWAGEAQLEPLLVSLSDLQPHPRNPRRGDVVAISKSLSRFGQYRPILANSEGLIIAGSHTYKAAKHLGWTHIAAVRTVLSEEEQRAALVADNRLSDLAGWEEEQLADLLRELAEEGRLDGTGYQPSDVDDLLASLAAAGEDGGELEREARGYRLPDADVREVVLLLPPDRHEKFASFVKMLGKEHGTESTSETVYTVVERAARSL